MIRDPLTELPFPGNQIPLSRISPTALAILNDTANYPLPNRNVSGVTGNYVGETLFKIRAHQGDLRLDWNASSKRQALRPLLVRHLHGRARPAGLPARLRDPKRPAVLERRRQLEPRVRALAHQRGARRLQPHDRDRRDLRLGRSRRRQRALRDRGRPADRRLELHHQRHRGLRRPQRPHGPGSDRDGLRHPGQDLPDQREAHLAHGPPRLQVRRPVPALRPAALLRRQQRAARVTSPTTAPSRGSQFADFLLDQVSGKGRGGGDPERPLDAPPEPDRASSSRTTSRSRRA